jgi:hypothetical protein
MGCTTGAAGSSDCRALAAERKRRRGAGVCTEIAIAIHADWVRRASRMLDEERRAGRGVGRWIGCWFRFTLGSGGGRGGERDLSGRLRRRRHGSQSTGMAAGVKPRSREAVRVFAQGFTRDDSPGDNEWRSCEVTSARLVCGRDHGLEMRFYLVSLTTSSIR